MFEKLVFMVFGKVLDKILNTVILNRKPEHHQVALMVAHKLILREQADNIIAELERRAPLTRTYWVYFTLPGNMAPKHQTYLMNYARHYVASNFDAFDFDMIRFSWRNIDIDIRNKQRMYTKSLPDKTWHNVQRDYIKSEKFSDVR